MPKTSAGSPGLTLERARLDNGLRVVLLPDRSAPVVAVAVYYDVGIRSEPEGRTGFAHLFEHLMFQGSASLEKMEHVRLVQSSGGMLNGTTRLDHTNYYEALPSSALERALFLEADRMRSPRLTAETLANQIAVVQEEIRVNVLDRPFGGFSWIDLPAVLFDTFPNAHNGYGGFEDLESATLADAESFFQRYYAPANAVLAVGGDFGTEQARTMVEHWFADIPHRPAPDPAETAEPEPTGERRAEQTDDKATTRAVGLAWRVPDPADLTAYLPYLLLAEILASGEASRLRRRLVHEEHLVTDISASLGFLGDGLDVRDPTALVVEAHFGRDVSADRIVAAIDGELDRLGVDGVAPEELGRVRARARASLLSRSDHILGRTLQAAVYELQRGRPELVSELPGLLAHVTGDDVANAASRCVPDRRARLDVIPGAPR